MPDALQCPNCQSLMTSRLDVDGLQHRVHARCEKCGFELDLADRARPTLHGADWVALVLSAAAMLGLVNLASSLEQLEKMLADFAWELPAVTSWMIRYQLPVPFLVVSALTVAVGAVRRAKGQRGGAALLWAGCAVAVVGLVVCAWGLYLPLQEMSGQIADLPE